MREKGQMDRWLCVCVIWEGEKENESVRRFAVQQSGGMRNEVQFPT